MVLLGVGDIRAEDLLVLPFVHQHAHPLTQASAITALGSLIGVPKISPQISRKLLYRALSGTESVILNRVSGDSESCDSNRAIPRSL